MYVCIFLDVYLYLPQFYGVPAFTLPLYLYLNKMLMSKQEAELCTIAACSSSLWPSRTLKCMPLCHDKVQRARTGHPRACCGDLNKTVVLSQGIDVFDPKFNIVSPGADPDVYFPYTQEDRRLKKYHAELKELLYGGPEKGKAVGQLEHRDKPIIFRYSTSPAHQTGRQMCAWHRLELVRLLTHCDCAYEKCSLCSKCLCLKIALAEAWQTSNPEQTWPFCW